MLPSTRTRERRAAPSKEALDMNRLVIALAALGILGALHAPAQADAKCDPAALSGTLEERMKSEGKSEAEIADILNSGFKRRVLTGRVTDASGCPDSAVAASLDLLAAKYK